MLKFYFLFFLVAVAVCGEAYLKTFEEGGEATPERPTPYEQAMLKRLQTYLDAAEERQQRFSADADLPTKRQMRYNQCYFNPISCFKKRK